MKFLFIFLIISLSSCFTSYFSEYERHSIVLESIKVKERQINGEMTNLYECLWIVDDRYTFTSYEKDTFNIRGRQIAFLKR